MKDLELIVDVQLDSEAHHLADPLISDVDVSSIELPNFALGHDDETKHGDAVGVFEADLLETTVVHVEAAKLLCGLLILLQKRVIRQVG